MDKKRIAEMTRMLAEMGRPGVAEDRRWELLAQFLGKLTVLLCLESQGRKAVKKTSVLTEACRGLGG